MEGISNCQVLVLQITDGFISFSEIAGPDRIFIVFEASYGTFGG